VAVMPLQPYSHPSGPQVRLLKTLCLHCSDQPSSTTSGLPIFGSSALKSQGTKSRLGSEQSETPPKPSSVPERLAPLSKTTVRLSKVPSPSVSSKTMTRSPPSGLSVHFG